MRSMAHIARGRREELNNKFQTLLSFCAPPCLALSQLLRVHRLMCEEKSEHRG